MTYPIAVVVHLLKTVYEGSCPFLSIKPLYRRDGKPVTLVDYIGQFWLSKFKNKPTAQYLIAEHDLVGVIANPTIEVEESEITSLIEELLMIGALCPVKVDIHGSEIQKLILMPLGLRLWERLDNGPLLNQQRISGEGLQQLTRSMLSEVLGVEREAWLHRNQGRLRLQSRGPFTKEMVCFGIYLLLNGAIARNHAFNLTRTSNKNFQLDNTMVQGLNVVAINLFGDGSLFKVPSLQDVLQRRSELQNHVGPSLRWLRPRKGELEEYYWWEIGDFREDSSTLEHITLSLVRRVVELSKNEENLPVIDDRLQLLLGFFRHGVNNQLSRFEMSELFPNQPASDFNYALQASINSALNELNENTHDQ